MVEKAVGAAPKAVPGQIVTWGASKLQKAAAPVAGMAASGAIGAAGSTATSEACKGVKQCN